MRKSVIAAGLAILLGSSAAWAVQYVGSPYIPKANGVASYNKTSPTSGTVTFFRGQSEMIIGGSSTITSLTIALTPAAYVYDGQQNCIYTKPAITTLTLSVTSPTTLNDAVTSMSATTKVCYTYSASNNTWDRSL